jgi:hypothetical protein
MNCKVIMTNTMEDVGSEATRWREDMSKWRWMMTRDDERGGGVKRGRGIRCELIPRLMISIDIARVARKDDD